MKRAGFTLIELLVSMILIGILLGTIVTVLESTTGTIKISNARTSVYEQARHAMDMLETDLMGCLAFNPPPADLSAPFSPKIPTSQRFILENGYSNSTIITYGSSGTWNSHIGRAADRVKFSTITSAGDSMQQVRVIYELKRYGEVYGTVVGRQGVNTKRELFTLVRRLRDPGRPDSQPPNVTDNGGTILQDEELCHFIVSFNIEYYASNRLFCQLESGASPFGVGPCPPNDPLGDDDLEIKKTNGPLTQGNDTRIGNSLRIPYLRFTLQIVDDLGERQERIISRVIWLPCG